jgi:hypothetical protein
VIDAHIFDRTIFEHDSNAYALNMLYYYEYFSHRIKKKKGETYYLRQHFRFHCTSVVQYYNTHKSISHIFFFPEETRLS